MLMLILLSVLALSFESYWDRFYSPGIMKPILHFEFAIDTGGLPPVCRRKPRYGPHESKIIMTQIQVLLNNGLIRLCKGAWDSSIILAVKSHQEQVTNIDEFVWRMCVSYRRLNQVTLPFEYPIPRYMMTPSTISATPMVGYILSALTTKPVIAHQIGVPFANQDKLAFFGPDGKKYTFNVMPFGSHNAPAFYTRMMLVFRGEYDSLFKERRPNDMAHKGSSTIIDNILLWPTSLDTLLAYSECVCSVFMKYRVTFQLKKCEFLTNRIKYVGHDITPNSNCPAQSKFDLITDWPLPATGQSLGSFISLVLLQHLLPFL